MLYLVEQYGDIFFVVKKISGYKPPTINGTKITEEEYKKLFNSNVNNKTRMRGVGNFCRSNGCSIERFRIAGNAKEILNRDDILTIS